MQALLDQLGSSVAGEGSEDSGSRWSKSLAVFEPVPE